MYIYIRDGKVIGQIVNSCPGSPSLSSSVTKSSTMGCGADGCAASGAAALAALEWICLAFLFFTAFSADSTGSSTSWVISRSLIEISVRRYVSHCKLSDHSRGAVSLKLGG